MSAILDVNYLIRVFYSTKIFPIWRNVSHWIQQVLPWNPHVIKPNPPHWRNLLDHTKICTCEQNLHWWTTSNYHIRPLSTPFRPILCPQSAIRMLGQMLPSASLICTINAWTPWLIPLILSWEKATVCVACCTATITSILIVRTHGAFTTKIYDKKK